MATVPTLSESLRATLEADFPGWRFIVSDKGRYWALCGPLPSSRLNARDAADADTIEELREKLRTQTRSRAELMFPPTSHQASAPTVEPRRDAPEERATPAMRP